MAKTPGILSSASMKKELERLGAQVHDMADEEGNTITRKEALMLQVWKMALGYTEKKRDDRGIMCEVYHAPAPWAMQLVIDRIDGKVGTAVVETSTGLRASEKVSELSRDRINAMARTAVGPPKIK